MSKYLAILAILMMITAGLLVFVFHDVLVATAVFFAAWGVWFASLVYKV